jgi:hypothetical protein
LAVVVVASTIIGGVATTMTAIEKIHDILGHGRARAVYRPLVADLANVERVMHALGDLKTHTGGGVVQVEVQMLENAAEPVCNARRSVSELGDASTRQELDTICAEIEMIKKLAVNTPDGIGAVSFANLIDGQGVVKKLREKLLPWM